MKNLISSKKIVLVILVLSITVVFSHQTIEKYRDISREYIKRDEIEEARRYYNFIVHYSDGKLKKEDVLLDLDIYSYEEDTREFLIYSRKQYQKYRYEEILRNIIEISSGSYFDFQELKDILRHSLIVYPDQFEPSLFKRLVFYRETGLDIQEANTYRRELKEYLNTFKDSEELENMSLKYLLLFMFEFNKPEKALEILDNNENIPYRDELTWYIYNIMLEKYDKEIEFKISDPVFKVFTLFFDHVFKHKDTSQQLSRLSEDTYPYNFISAANVDEELEHYDQALLNLLKAKETDISDASLLSIIDDNIRRLKARQQQDYYVEKVKHLIKRGEYEEAYTFTQFLEPELNIYYKVYILFYYFNNYEKALELINSVVDKSVELKYLEAEIYMKGYEYERSEELFKQVYDSGHEEYFESSLFNLIKIYQVQGNLDDMEKLSLKVYDRLGQQALSGRLFLSYVDALIESKKVDKARDTLHFILYSFSDNDNIYSQAGETLEKLEKVGKISSLDQEYKLIMGYLRGIENQKKRQNRANYISPQERLRRMQEYRKQNGYEKIPEFNVDTQEIQRKREQLQRYNFSTEEIEIRLDEYIQRVKNQRIQNYLSRNRTSEVELNDDTNEISIDTDEIEITQGTQEISPDTVEVGVDTEDDLMRRKYSMMSASELELEIVRVAAETISCTKEERDPDKLIEYCERILKDSDTFQIQQLKSLAIINLAQAYYDKYDQIDKVVEYFYSKLKGMLNRMNRSGNNESKEDQEEKLRFYYENVIDFFIKNEFYSKATEIIDNYYAEVDRRYEYTQFLMTRIECSLILDEIDIDSMRNLIRKEPEALDELIIEKEIFDRKELGRLGGRLDRLEKTYSLIEEYKELKEIKDKYRFYKREGLNRHIAMELSDILGAFEDSREVYDYSRQALIEENDIENLSYVLKIEKNRFEDFTASSKEIMLVLENAIKNYPYDKVIETFSEYSPMDDELIKGLDLSDFDLDFYIKLFELNPDSRFLGKTILDIYFETDSSDLISGFIKENTDYLDYVISHYIEVRDYELADFYFNQYKGKTSKAYNDYLNRRFAGIIKDYRNLNEYRARLNNSLLADYEIIFQVVDKAKELGLYDEAKNYLLVYKQLTGRDVEKKIEELEKEEELKKLKEKIDKEGEERFVLGKYLYLLSRYDKDNELFKEQENKNIVEDMTEIIAEFDKKMEKVLAEKDDTKEVIISDEKEEAKDSSEVQVFTEEEFKEAKEKKDMKKAEKASRYLAEYVDAKYYYELARLYEGTRKFKKAIENYREFILNCFDDEKAPESQYKIGLLNVQLNNINAANKAFLRMERYFPDEKTYNYKAEDKLTQIAQGKIRKQLDELDIIEREIEYDEMDRFEDISDNIDEIKNEMTRTTNAGRLAALNAKLGKLYIEKFADYETALGYLRAARDNGDDSKETIERIATCYIKNREYSLAVESYRDYLSKLVDTEKKAYIALKIINIYVENLKEYNKALEEIDIYTAQYDNTEGYYEALYLRAYIHENHYKDFQKAISEYTVLTNEFESEYAAQAQMRIARIYEEYLKDYTNAKLAYEKLINEFADADLKQEAEMSIRRLQEDGKI